MPEEQRLIKRLVVEVFEDGTRTIDGFGWGKMPTMAVFGVIGQTRPWLVGTEVWTIQQLGELLACAVDSALEIRERNYPTEGP